MMLRLCIAFVIAMFTLSLITNSGGLFIGSLIGMIFGGVSAELNRGGNNV